MSNNRALTLRFNASSERETALYRAFQALPRGFGVRLIMMLLREVFGACKTHEELVAAMRAVADDPERLTQYRRRAEPPRRSAARAPNHGLLNSYGSK